MRCVVAGAVGAVSDLRYHKESDEVVFEFVRQRRLTEQRADRAELRWQSKGQS